MKNKKFTIGLTLLVAGSMFLTNCTKNKTNEAPTPDTELQSTKDVVKVQIILTDIMEIGAEAADGATNIFPLYNFTPLSIMQGTNVINSVAALPVDLQTAPKYYLLTFNNTVGKDGHVRSGVLKFDYSSSANPIVFEHRQPEFNAVVTSTAYTVDDYSVTINSMVLKNTTPVGFPSVTYFPSTTKLTWKLTANVSIARASGAEVLTWNGVIDKTLLNTNNTAVPMPLIGSQTFTVYQGPFTASSGTLYWNKAYISYTGAGVISVPGLGSCDLTMTNLTRNMNSSPEVFYASGGKLVTPERHPFIYGLMNIKPSSKPARDVDFGAPDVVDYNAKVTISGITYEVDCN